MAAFGANHPCFKPDTSETGVVLERLVSANLTVTLASGELFADDGLAEKTDEFASGSIAMETDDMSDENAAILYGATIKDKTVVYNKDDSAPMGSLAYFKALMYHGVKYYKGYYYPRARAALGNDNAQTKGSSITFQTTTTTFTIFADDDGNWRETEIFNTRDAALAWCETKTNVKAHFAINVSVQGADAGEGATPAGTSYVAQGEDFTLTISSPETVTAAYDNGEDKGSDIQSGGGTYTVTAVDKAHDIVIIY